MSDFSLAFRNAMANLPSPVSIVTTEGKAGKVGLTVSAVCSVSDNPATLLFCINQSSGTHTVFKQNGTACVNVLSASQQELAEHFANMLDSTMEQRFEWDIWKATEQPALKEAVSTLQGKIINTYEVGTHTVFILQLTDIDTQEDDVLTYFNRGFQVAKFI
ncbi:flavin reductase [Phocoenobacter skyensis]|uniref:Flavin reductase n=1 Tax=Phocoenobacter skyensis TaxID=97481 RepID=A0A1H7VF62_9PAST|nr:flavin reductase [Pasteurella skyensis]MDP8079368.1 flavin reductase [Pasteurella skyensis]MDP8085240.1 flavin reductase [Pasteurella skyensis]MDP8162695.1 flavin reductase [Pasteurella skyensis]MDP8171431.1 flavin reductase [Pasteurella skyensis]MDP8173463.1 flavin reductase [Pasteurella skyensis]